MVKSDGETVQSGNIDNVTLPAGEKKDFNLGYIN